MKEEHERFRDDEAAERERLEVLAAALKEVSQFLIRSRSHFKQISNGGYSS